MQGAIFNAYRMRQNERGKKDQLAEKYKVLRSGGGSWVLFYIYFGASGGRRGRATSAAAVHSAVCEDGLRAILLILTDSLMLRAQIIPALSLHIGGSSRDGETSWPTYP